MPSEKEWAERIRAGWLKYGTGQPLSERTVLSLAREFAKPLMPVPVSDLTVAGGSLLYSPTVEFQRRRNLEAN